MAMELVESRTNLLQYQCTKCGAILSVDTTGSYKVPRYCKQCDRPSIDYRLKLFGQYFYVMRWSKGHECNCEFCERPTGAGWVHLEEIDGGDNAWDAEGAIEELYSWLGLDPPTPAEDRC